MYNLNECVYNHPFKIDLESTDINKYSNNDGKIHNILKGKISEFVSVNNNNITITAGGDDAIMLCINTLFFKNRGVIYKYNPSYTKIEDMGYNVISLETPLINKYKTMEFYNPPNNSIIYICNPCNPLGDVWDNADIIYLCKKYTNCNIIVDQAYIEFHDIKTTCSDVNTYNNLFYIRTFSKLFGLAGMRLGYLVHNDKFINNYPFKSILTLTKNIGIKVLDNLKFYNNVNKLITFNKKELNIQSACNFIFIRVSYGDLPSAKKKLEINNINARYGYGTGIRITIHPYMDNIDFLRSFIQEYNTMPDIRLSYTPIDLRIKLYYSLKLLMNNFNYHWWMDGSSWIGTVLYNTIIPYDCHIDIGMLHLNNYAEFEENLSKTFNIKKHKLSNMCFQLCDKSFKGNPDQTMHINIFPYKNINNTIVNIDEQFRYNGSDKTRLNKNYNPDEIIALKHEKFYDITVPIPNIDLNLDNINLFYLNRYIYTKQNLILV